MSAEKVFEVLNALIAEHNALMSALGDVLADGQLSYNALADKPSLDGVELTGDVSTADLALSVDSAVLDRVSAMESSLSSFGSLRESDAERISSLENYRAADIARVSTLESERTARESQLNTVMTLYNTTSEKASQAQAEASAAQRALQDSFSTYTEQLSARVESGKSEVLSQVAREYATTGQLSAGLAAKADASGTPTVTQWNTLKASMDSAVAQAEVAAEGVTSNEAFLEVVDRVKKTINRLNMVADAVVLLENHDCTSGRQSLNDAMNGQCIADISNTFTFE